MTIGGTPAINGTMGKDNRLTSLLDWLGDVRSGSKRRGIEIWGY